MDDEYDDEREESVHVGANVEIGAAEMHAGEASEELESSEDLDSEGGRFSSGVHTGIRLLSPHGG